MSLTLIFCFAAILFSSLKISEDFRCTLRRAFLATPSKNRIACRTGNPGNDAVHAYAIVSKVCCRPVNRTYSAEITRLLTATSRFIAYHTLVLYNIYPKIAILFTKKCVFFLCKIYVEFFGCFLCILHKWLFLIFFCPLARSFFFIFLYTSAPVYILLTI